MDAPRPERVLNLKLLVATIVVSAVVGAGVAGLYYFQVRRTAGLYLAQVDQLEAEVEQSLVEIDKLNENSEALLAEVKELKSSGDTTSASERESLAVRKQKEARAMLGEIPKKWYRASVYLHRYLRLRPDDGPARIRLAKAFGNAIVRDDQKSRAIDLYSRAIGLASGEEEQDLRVRLAELLLDRSQFLRAENQISPLDESNADRKRIIAVAKYGQYRAGALATEEQPKVAGAFHDAVDANPHRIELAINLALIYRKEEELLPAETRNKSPEDRDTLADDVMDQMVAANPDDATAYLARYKYRTNLKRNDPYAEADLDKAKELMPNSAAVRYASAKRAMKMSEDGRSDGLSEAAVARWNLDARRDFQFLVDNVHPASPSAYLGLGQTYLNDGDPDQAIKIWREGLEWVGSSNLAINIRLGRLLVAEGRLDECKAVLDILEKELQKIRAGNNKNYLAEVQQADDLLRSAWRIKRGQYVQAIPLLRRVVSSGATRANRDVEESKKEEELDEKSKAWILLGDVYSALGQWDQAALAFENVVKLNPRANASRLAAALAWTAAGQSSAAIRLCKSALAWNKDKPHQAHFLMARALLQEQLRRAPEEREWERFRNHLALAKQSPAISQSWQAALLDVDVIVSAAEEQGKLREGYVEAAKMLRAAEAAFPDSPQLARTLVFVYERMGYVKDADRAMANFKRLEKSATSSLVLESRLLANRQQFTKARKMLESGLQRIGPDGHSLIEAAIAQLHIEEGDLESAVQRLMGLYQKDPENVSLMRRLAELSFDLEDWAAVEKWENRIRNEEGHDGTYWSYCKARRLLTQAKRASDPGFMESVLIQQRLELLRPSWAPVKTLKGLTAERKGDIEGAIAAYTEAVRLGEQRVIVYERLIAMLYRTQQFAEAQRYLSRLERRVASSSNLSVLAMSVAARRNAKGEAVNIARRAVEKRPLDIMAKVWLGHMLNLNGESKEAESVLQAAVQVAPEDIRALNGLFTFFVRSKQNDKARTILDRLIKIPTLREPQRKFIHAQGLELLGDLKSAEKAYRAARKDEPNSVPIQSRLTALMLKTSIPEGEKELRILLKMAPGLGAARRTLATILALRGGDQAWNEIDQLLAGDDASSELDRRLQAVLLARKLQRSDWEKSKTILEGLIARQTKPVPGDHLLLAQICEKLSRQSEAKAELLLRQGKDGQQQALGSLSAEEKRYEDQAFKQYMALVAGREPNRRHLALFIDFLLRRERVKDAKFWLRKLEGLKSKDLAPLATLSLRTRILLAEGEEKEIAPLVNEQAKVLYSAAQDDKARGQIALRVGNVLTAVDQHSAAEVWYRRLFEKLPDQYRPLAICLARQGLTKEAIAVCEESEESQQKAITVAAVLLNGNPGPEDFRMANKVFGEALRSGDRDAELLRTLANVRVVEEKLEEAINLYEEVLKLRPRDVLAMNNLATLLSENPDRRDRALKVIDQAIELSGPHPALLDTKGMILFYGRQTTDAIEILEESVATNRPDARYYLHLAIAYQYDNNPDAARRALEQAEDRELTRQILTQSDQRLLTELRQYIKQ